MDDFATWLFKIIVEPDCWYILDIFTIDEILNHFYNGFRLFVSSFIIVVGLIMLVLYKEKAHEN